MMRIPTEKKDKANGSTHATVVADLAETTKPKGERGVLESERRNQTNQANSKMKAPGATTETRRGRQEAEYLPQENQRSDATSLSTRN